MTLIYIKKLGPQIQKTEIEAQKNDTSSLDIFEIVIAGFQVINELSRVWFFQKIFFLANTSIKVILEIPFLTINNINV